MNKEDFITYEQAVKLKKLGFKERCYQHYDTSGIIQDNCYICNQVYQWVISSNLYISNNEYTQRCGLSSEKSICDAPTLAQAQKWLRKEKKLSVEPMSSDTDAQDWEYLLVDRRIEFANFHYNHKHYASYEEALSAGITECLKLLEKNGYK